MQIITPEQLFIGSAGAAIFAGGSVFAKLLTPAGGVAAFLVGVCVFGFGGFPFAVVLLAFFLSSSLLSTISGNRKAILESGYEKGSRRDAGQVIANGFIASLLAVGHALDLRFAPPRFCMLLFIGVVATVTADTWATEIGGLSRRRPLMITTFRMVAPGRSGGITLLGTAAALLGASFVALVGWLMWPSHSFVLLWQPDMPEMIACIWAAFLGCFADSILGGSVQSQYMCQVCQAIVEKRDHCNAPCVFVRGWRWVNNDVVNFIASLSGLIFVLVLLKAASGVK